MSISLLGSIQMARGTTAERTAVTLLIGEICFDTTLSTAYIGDGTTAGGIPIAAAGSAIWGTITGTLSSQTDLVAALLKAQTSLVSINAQSGTTYALVLTDAGSDVQCTNASSITLTVPPNSSIAFPVGTMVIVSQGGAGVVTITAGAGVTLRAANGATTSAIYDGRVIEKIATDTWRIW